MRGRMTLFVLLMAAQVTYAFDFVPKAEYRERRVKLAAELHGGSAVIFAAHEPPMEYQDYRQDEDFFYLDMCGGVLLSREASLAVPSALRGLTSGFGMGPGVSPSQWPPQLYGIISLAPGRIPGTA